MMTLETIVLPPVWFDPEIAAASGLQSEMVVSRGGTPMIFESELGFRKADLIGSDDAAWITYADLTALRAMADAAGAAYSLNVGGEIFTVRFRNWESPAVSAVPVFTGLPPASDDPFHSVRIKLILEP